MTPAKRLIVRTALITGSTLATLFGAQSLASLAPQPTADTQIAPSESQPGAPNITIIRRAAAPEIGITPQAAVSVQIQPPVPVIVQPAIVAPSQPRSQSSR